MNMNGIKALIFDLDGVIIDSEPLHAEAKQIAFEKYQIVVPPNLYAEFRGRSDQDMVEHVVSKYAEAPLSASEVLDYKHHLFSASHEKLQPVAGSLEFIRVARANFKKLALTTSATKKNMQCALEKFHLESVFDVIVTAEEIIYTKPHPEPYSKTVAELGLSPESCLVIEDSSNGVLSAKGAGCLVVGITTSFSRDDLASAKADYVIDSFSELANLLKLED